VDTKLVCNVMQCKTARRPLTARRSH